MPHARGVKRQGERATLAYRELRALVHRVDISGFERSRMARAFSAHLEPQMRCQASPMPRPAYAGRRIATVAIRCALGQRRAGLKRHPFNLTHELWPRATSV